MNSALLSTQNYLEWEGYANKAYEPFMDDPLIKVFDNTPTFENAAAVLDVRSQLDGLVNFADEDSKQNDIVDELKAWKKFYLNQERKQRGKKGFIARRFVNILTKGEIEKFIRSQLSPNVRRGLNLVKGVPNPIWDVTTGDELPSGVTEQVFDLDMKAMLQKRLRLLYRSQLDSEQIIFESAKIVVDIAKQIDDKVSKQILFDFINDDLMRLKSGVERAELISTITDSLDLRMRQASSSTRTALRSRVSKNRVSEFLINQLGDTDAMLLSEGRLIPLISRRWDSYRRLLGKKLKGVDVFDSVIDTLLFMRNNPKLNRHIFKMDFTNLLHSAINGKTPTRLFSREIRKMTRGHMQNAFRTGVEALGLDPKNVGGVERFIINRLIAKETILLDTFLDTVVSGIANPLFNATSFITKGDLWYNKTIDKFLELGRLSADRNGLYAWRLGQTEHCRTCFAASMQVHRLRRWHEVGILPRDHGAGKLICGGFRCQCQLFRVTGQSQGRLDRIPIVGRERVRARL